MLYERKNLILDYTTNPFTFDLELTNDIDDLDFKNQGSLSDQGLITDNLVFFYDFSYYNDINTATSLFPYKEARPTGSTLVLNKVGDIISYEIDNYLDKKVISLDGGYYSGIYLSGMTTGSTYVPYQVVPSPAPIGYTLNLWVKPIEGNLFGIGDDNNGYNFYYKDGRIGWDSHIERIDDSGNTITMNYSGNSNLIFTGSTGNPWINVTIVFKRNEALKKCCIDCDDNLYNIINEPFPDCITLDNIPDTNKGELSFYVNGRPAYKTIIEEPIIKTHEIKIADEFVGFMSVISMYDKPLTIPEIIRNYYGLKDIYKRLENFGGAETIVNSNLIK